MTGQLGDWLQGVYVFMCVCVCLCVRVCDVCVCVCAWEFVMYVCVYDHVRMCKCVVCMCGFVYVNYNELIHSPQHTTLCTATSQPIILPTLHHTLHPPHRNLKPHCRSSNPRWWQSSFRANNWKTAALLRTTLSSPATKTSSTLPGQTSTLTALAGSINWRRPCYNRGSSVML